MNTVPDELAGWLQQYSQLSEAYHALYVPYASQIDALEEQFSEETASLRFQMKTLEALIRPVILEAKQTQKVPFVTVTYVQKDSWDSKLLLKMSEEVPAIMQAYKDASVVQFRKTGR